MNEVQFQLRPRGKRKQMKVPDRGASRVAEVLALATVLTCAPQKQNLSLAASFTRRYS